MNELEKNIRSLVMHAINSELIEDETIDIITKDIFREFQNAIKLSSELKDVRQHQPQI